MPPDETLRDAELLRVGSTSRPIEVDRKANVLRGMVVAQLGPFKSQGRGEFDQQSLDLILQLGSESKLGLKSRFSHPTECNDGLGRYLGRVRNPFMSEATTRDGKKVPAVRGDLHFDATALDTPPDGGKPLGIYVMDLAESDPEAISSSLVLRVKKEFRLNPDKTAMKDANGEELPPLWRPYKLWAADVVDTGDAVDGLLSANDLPNAALWKGAELLNGMFEGLTREELADRLHGWLGRYLDERFGPVELAPTPAQRPAESTQPELSNLVLRQRQRERESLT